MQDAKTEFAPDLADLSQDDWQREIQAIAEENGFFLALGRKHFAAHVQRGQTLVVSFETVQGIRTLGTLGAPIGWELVRAHNWSSLCIAAHGDTWFRDPDVIELFDGLADDGYFDAFETVLFYGAGPCGYAAAAFSVAAPGARVLAIQPQATLDARMTEWDDRFVEMRRTDFRERYGYAPDMLDACAQAFVIYDPLEQLDAMHATLFMKAGALPLRMPRMGGALQSDMVGMGILTPILTDAATDKLGEASFARHYRARRDYRPYLRRLLGALDTRSHDDLAYLLTRNVTKRMNAARFARKQAEIEAARAKEQPPRSENSDAEGHEG